MPLGVVDIRKFGGVRLSSDRLDVGLESAITANNVEIATDRTYVRLRDGLKRLGANRAMGAAPAECYRAMPHTDTSGVELMIALSTDATNVNMYTYSLLGVVTLIGSWARSAFDEQFYDSVNFGTPTASQAFFSNDSVFMRRYQSGALAVSVGKPKYLAVTPTSNRLVQARFRVAADSPTGANGSLSTVFFSDAGAPETFSANNFIHLRPGDGEDIRGMAVYRGQLYVFKQSTMFIFSGESVGSTGAPVFDYRAVSLPVSIDPSVGVLRGPVVVAGENGVYYLAGDGLYRTTGGPPVRVSQALDRAFVSTDVVSLTTVRQISASDHRILLQNSGDQYVYDERMDQWTYWSSAVLGISPKAPIVSWPAGRSSQIRSHVWTSLATMYYSSEQVSDDFGNAIDANYTTGFSDLGAASIKTVKRVQVWGSGVVTVGLNDDLEPADAGSAVTLSSAFPSASTGYRSLARRGTQFQLKLSSNSLASDWQVGAVELHVRRPRAVGSKL